MGVYLTYSKPNSKGVAFAKIVHYSKELRKCKSTGLFIYKEYDGKELTHEELKHNKKIEAQLENMLLQRQTEFTNSGYNVQLMFVERELNKYYERYATNKGNFHKYAYTHFKKFLREEGILNISIKSFNPEQARYYKEYLINSGLKPSTQKNYLTSIKLCFTQAFHDEILDRSPFARIKNIRVPDKVHTSLESAELKKLIGTEGDSHIKIAFLISVFTGLRISDIRNLKYSDLTRIPERKGFYQLDIVQQKTKKKLETILVPGGSKLLDETRIGQDKYIFKLPSCTTVNKYVREWMEEQGIKKEVTFRVSRNTFAQLLSKNSNIKIVSYMMGHTNWSTTKGYVNTTFDEVLFSLIKMQEMFQNDEFENSSGIFGLRA
jgi:integrase